MTKAGVSNEYKYEGWFTRESGMSCTRRNSYDFGHKTNPKI